MHSAVLPVLSKCSSGLYVVSSHIGEKINGQISDALIQVSSNPPKVALSIYKKELTHEFIVHSKEFGVSLLSQTTNFSLIKLFGFNSGRDVDKFVSVKYRLSQMGNPMLLENVAAFFEAKVFQMVDLTTHTLFLAEVVTAEMIADIEPLTYAYYRSFLKRKTNPKSLR